MIHGRIGRALGRDRRRIVREPPLGECRPIHDRHDAVHGDPRADRRPAECLQKRLRQREAGGFYQDVLGRPAAFEQGLHGRQEILGDRAAQAAIRQLDDVFLLAALDAAGAQGFAVDAERAELVDDDRDPPPAGMRQQMPNQSRLSGTQEPSDDGGRDLGGGVAHAGVSGEERAGSLPSTTVRSEAGRLDGSTAPLAEAAYAAPYASRSAAWPRVSRPSR